MPGDLLLSLCSFREELREIAFDVWMGNTPHVAYAILHLRHLSCGVRVCGAEDYTRPKRLQTVNGGRNQFIPQRPTPSKNGTHVEAYAPMLCA